MLILHLIYAFSVVPKCLGLLDGTYHFQANPVTLGSNPHLTLTHDLCNTVLYEFLTLTIV